MPDHQPRLLRALAGETLDRPPIWLMRQAGRSLPEYRALRAKADDFIAFCLDAEMAAEATLQPMRRFPLDAAIVFADILLLPRALGQDVWFSPGEGPRLGHLPTISSLSSQVELSVSRLEAVGETLRRVRAQLEPERAVIGFAGGPWTVATYMLGGDDRAAARAYAYRDPDMLDDLLEVLSEATIHYLAMQAGAGAQALKIFESWAEGLPEDLFDRLVVRPHARIVEGLRAAGVTAPIIGFPRGAGVLVSGYADCVSVEAVALDQQASLLFGTRLQARGKTIQGGLDNLLLREGGKLMDARVDELMASWGSGPWVFNLGHGVLPDTPLENIGRLVGRVTGLPVKA